MLSTRASDVMRLTSPIVTLELRSSDMDDNDYDAISSLSMQPPTTTTTHHVPLRTATASCQRLTGTTRATLVPQTSTAVGKTRSRFADVHVVMGLLMSVVGSGMLSVPYTFVLIPPTQAAMGLVAVAICMAATATALLAAIAHAARTLEQTQHRVGAGHALATLQALARYAGGDAFALVVSVVTALGIFGGCVGGIRIVRDLTPHIARLLLSVASDASSSSSSEDALANALLWGSAALVVLPLCLLRDLSALRLTNYVGFVCSVYLVLAVAYRSLAAAAAAATPQASIELLAPPALAPIELTESAALVHASRHLRAAATAAVTAAAASPTSTASAFARFAQATSIYNFAFMMHLNLLALFVQLRTGASSSTVDVHPTLTIARSLDATRKRMAHVVAGVASFCLVLYSALGVSGAALYGAAIQGNLLLNLERDAAMAIPLVAVFATVLLTFPLLFHPLRSIVEDGVVRLRRPATATAPLSFAALSSVQTAAHGSVRFRTRIVLTLALLGAALVLATQVPGVEVVFSLVGATTCALICVVFPVVIYTRVVPWTTSRWRIVSAMVLWTIVAFEVVIGATTVLSLLT